MTKQNLTPGKFYTTKEQTYLYEHSENHIFDMYFVRKQIKLNPKIDYVMYIKNVTDVDTKITCNIFLHKSNLYQISWPNYSVEDCIQKCFEEILE